MATRHSGGNLANEITYEEHDGSLNAKRVSVVQGVIVRANKVFQATTITNTNETTVLTAEAATYLDVYGVIVSNTSATNTEVAFKDSTGGTTRFTIAVPAGETRGFMLSPTGAHNQTAAGDNWTATAADAVSSLLITVFAVKNT